jgi:hypothetical protein
VSREVRHLRGYPVRPRWCVKARSTRDEEVHEQAHPVLRRIRAA